MNKPIRAVSVFCMLLFLALMVNATWLQYARSDSYAEDPRNRRVIEAAYAAERGAILVGRETVAESLPSDDRYDPSSTPTSPGSSPSSTRPGSSKPRTRCSRATTTCCS
jgi:peptidoglycan glycosyltransferase